MEKNYKLSVGALGEDLAVNYLLKSGYKILARNAQVSHQEIDIIASIKGFYVFVEVKTRSNQNMGSGEEAISGAKVRNIRKAISSYCYYKKIDLDRVRFDAIIVNINKITRKASIKHYIKIF